MSYVPTPGPLPGDQYILGRDGYEFIDAHCSKCARDRALREGVDADECDDNELCEIVAASFRGEAVEWRILQAGTPEAQSLCTAFVPAGQPIPPPRCGATVDMFLGAA